MLLVVSRNCTIGPQVCEIAGGLPVGKTLLHLPSLTINEVRPEGEAFDLYVYGDFPNYYVDGEFSCVDMVNQAHFKIEVLNTILCSLGFEDDDVINLYYKIPFKSLDIGLKHLVSENNISSFLGYVHKQKMMYVYVELVETTEDSGDEDVDRDSENDSEDGQVNANNNIDDEHLVDEVEVNMTAFKFQIEGQGEDGQVDPINPLVTLIEDDLWVLDYDLFESDQEDVPENARKRIRAYSIETRRNINFKRNDKRRIRAVCKGVVPSIPGKNVFVDKDEGPKEDISKKVKLDVYKEKLDVYKEEDPEKTTRMFRRIYVCLGTLKRGFKEGGRELLGLDRAFIRGQYHGQMLTTMGVDANNGIYRVPYGIVESENQYSWTWFLTCLADDFDLFSNFNFTFITDRQKGLLPTIARLFLYDEHRYCVRVIWLEVEGVPCMTCWVRAIEVPGWVPDFKEDGEEGYDVNDGSHEDDMYGGVSENPKDVEGESDREEVPEINFEEVPDKSIFEGNSVRQNDVYSEDPFEKVDNWSDENRVNDGQEDGICVGQHVNERVEVSNDTHESTCSGHFKKSEVPRKGGSILELIDDLVNVGQTMGYDMTGCIKNMKELIESQGVDEIHR
nr:FAR1-related sequence 10 [Tanacetum cinerariifolium]